jgi:hypothetical protein
MNLLENIFAVHGGMARWHGVERFTASLADDGTLTGPPVTP